MLTAGVITRAGPLIFMGVARFKDSTNDTAGEEISTRLVSIVFKIPLPYGQNDAYSQHLSRHHVESFEYEIDSTLFFAGTV